jgi:hypothetical protein
VPHQKLALQAFIAAALLLAYPRSPKNPLQRVLSSRNAVFCAAACPASKQKTQHFQKPYVSVCFSLFSALYRRLSLFVRRSFRPFRYLSFKTTLTNRCLRSP